MVNKYTTIVFDLDGTLLNTLEDLMDAVNYALDKHGLPQCSLAQIRDYVGNGVRKLMERAVDGGVKAEEFEAMFEEFTDYYGKHNLNKTAPYEGALSLLEELKLQGYKMAIVSNKYQEGVTKLRQVFFDETISVAIGESPNVRRKPAPDSVLRALQELGSTTKEAIYIGDSEVDYATAQNSGLRFLAVTWGFRDREVLVKLGAKDFVDCPADILQKMAEWNSKEI